MAERTTFSGLLFSLFLLISINGIAQLADANRGALIHGSIVTTQGLPVAHATVEVRDLHGMKMASGFTDSAGSFAIMAAAEPGEYVLLAAKEWQIGDERVILNQRDREVKMALPVGEGNFFGNMPNYTVSAKELGVSEKARSHLRLANRAFRTLNLSEAEREVEQALQIDSTCAAAFSMRALLKLAAKKPDEAAEDAKQALLLDHSDADAYLALATAYNSLRKFESAEEVLEQALALRPDFWQGQLEMAKALYGQRRFVLALFELDDLSRDFPDVHLVRANVLEQLGRGQEAEKEFTQFLHEAPGDPRSEQVKRILVHTAEKLPPL